MGHLSTKTMWLSYTCTDTVKDHQVFIHNSVSFICKVQTYRTLNLRPPKQDFWLSLKEMST